MEASKHTTTPVSDVGPGNVLHQARSELRLQVEEVARMLNLSPSHITALENDDYESLFGPTYVRGYLRSYAQLLGLSPEKIIESYSNLAVAAKSVVLKQLSPAPQISSNDRIVKLATLLVVGVLAVLTVIWWQGQERTENRRTAAGADAPPAEASAPSSATETRGLFRDATVASVPALPPPTSAEESGPEIRALSPGPGVAGTVAGATAPTPPRPVSANTAPIASEAVGAPPPVTTVDQVAGPHARLVMYAEEDCWADIRDANQNRLLYETVAAGRVVMLEGVPPFSVFLGNGAGVRIEYNGRPFDISRHKRGPIARFMLGVSEAVSN